jgi:hypothetical protein
MSVKQKIRNEMGVHSCLETFGIGLGITFGVALVLGGLLNPEEAFAFNLNNGNNAVGQQRSCC